MDHRNELVIDVIGPDDRKEEGTMTAAVFREVDD